MLHKQRNEPCFLIHQSGFFEQIGLANVTANLDDALVRAKELLENQDAVQLKVR